MKTCPFCAEEIQEAAKVCKHCGRDLVNSETAQQVQIVQPRKTSIVTLLAAGFFVVAGLGWCNSSLYDVTNTSLVGGGVGQSQGATMAKFNRLDTGMSYAEAVRILGGPGTELSRSDLGGITTVMYQWTGTGIGNMNAMFQGDKLVNKAQFGLK